MNTTPLCTQVGRQSSTGSNDSGHLYSCVRREQAYVGPHHIYTQTRFIDARSQTLLLHVVLPLLPLTYQGTSLTQLHMPPVDYRGVIGMCAASKVASL